MLAIPLVAAIAVTACSDPSTTAETQESTAMTPSTPAPSTVASTDTMGADESVPASDDLVSTFPSAAAVLVADASGAAAASGTPLPDFGGASAGDDGAVRRPLGAVSQLSYRDRADFLYERGGPGKPRPQVFRDAVFVDIDDPQHMMAGWEPDRPFVVRHGFVNDDTEPLGPEFDVIVYAFQMDLPKDASGSDIGETLRFTSDYVLRGEAEQCGPTYRDQSAPVTCEWFVHDFPEGLPDEGRWALWAFWQAPCWAWIDYGFVEDCVDPDEIMAPFASGVDSPWKSDSVEWDQG